MNLAPCGAENRVLPLTSPTELQGNNRQAGRRDGPLHGLPQRRLATALRPCPVYERARETAEVDFGDVNPCALRIEVRFAILKIAIIVEVAFF